MQVKLLVLLCECHTDKHFSIHSCK